MRVLLAGSVSAGDVVYREIDGYTAANHDVTINTHYLAGGEVERLREHYSGNPHIHFCNFNPAVPEEFRNVVTIENIGFDAVIYPPNIEGFTPDVLQAAIDKGLQHPLRVIGCPNDAVSHLAKIAELADHQGVAIVNTPGVHASAVAEYTLNQIGFHARRLNHFYHETGQDGAWPHHDAVSTSRGLEGKTLGVLGGSGSDGAAVIALAKKMGLRVVAMGSGRAESEEKIRAMGVEVASSLQDLLSQSDFLSVNCRKNDHTIGIPIPAQELGWGYQNRPRKGWFCAAKPA